jgi:hypothetical protein
MARHLMALSYKGLLEGPEILFALYCPQGRIYPGSLDQRKRAAFSS